MDTIQSVDQALKHGWRYMVHFCQGSRQGLEVEQAHPDTTNGGRSKADGV